MKTSDIISLVGTLVTACMFVIMTFTFSNQKGFNEKQTEFNERVLHLTEASAIPLIFAVFDSLGEPKVRAHNVFYTIKNVGSTPGVKVRSGCKIDESRQNPLETELLDTGVVADLFPTQTKSVAAWRVFDVRDGLDTLYFHVRVDFLDMLDRKYYYMATYLIFSARDREKGTWKIQAKMEWSDFKPLGQKE